MYAHSGWETADGALQANPAAALAQQQREQQWHASTRATGAFADADAFGYYARLEDAAVPSVPAALAYPSLSPGVAGSFSRAAAAGVSGSPAASAVSRGSTGALSPSDTEAALDSATAAMHALHHQAIKQWWRRVKFCFALHMITALCLCYSHYWFTTVIGVVLLAAVYVFAFAIKMRQTTFVLLYLLIVLLNLTKNIMVLIFFFQLLKPKHGLAAFDQFLIGLCFVDVCLLTPYSFYSCFYLYRSVALTHLTF